MCGFENGWIILGLQGATQNFLGSCVFGTAKQEQSIG